MAWTDPTTRATGDLITASIWNVDLVDNLSYLRDFPLCAEVTANQTTTSTTYAALATAGPSVVLPRADDYVVEIGFHGYSTTVGASVYMSYDIGATPAVDADAALHDTPAEATLAVARAMVKTGLTAVTLTAKYRVTAGTGNFSKRWIKATPRGA